MIVKIFCHSLLSDWNHGNAHFLRGIVSDMMDRGFNVQVFEPRDAWSLVNLLQDRGEAALAGFRRAYPGLNSNQYDPGELDLEEALADADLVLVHEWNDHALVRKIGDHHARNPRYRLLFHDTHHRSVTDKASMAAYDLSNYDGVLAFGDVIRRGYLENGWAKRAWTWHEAADPRVFHPLTSLSQKPRPRNGALDRSIQAAAISPEATKPRPDATGDLVWVGNWGDEERTAELREFLLEPVAALGLKAKVYGVRYPEHALEALAKARIVFGGSLANYEAPSVFARYKVTVHVPRRPYVEALPGIPTIRVFEALACGIPLVSAPWTDSEHLFTPGKDFLIVENGGEMRVALRRVLEEPALAEDLARHGLETILARHTCAHRVDELLTIVEDLSRESTGAVAAL